MKRLALLSLLVLACGSPIPPDTIGVNGMPEEIIEAALTAADAWCAADVGWCPEIVAGASDAPIVIGDFKGQVRINEDGALEGLAAHNVACAYIEVAPLAVELMTPEELAAVLMHELGHFGIKGHVPSSTLMRSRITLGAESPDHVDWPAAREWLRQQGPGVNTEEQSE